MYVRKQIVHNLHVVRDLEAKGAIFVEEETEVPEAANRQIRRRMEYGGAGVPVKTKPASDRPGAAGRKSGKGAKKKR